jgi:hypothetical protein
VGINDWLDTVDSLAIDDRLDESGCTSTVP